MALTKVNTSMMSSGGGEISTNTALGSTAANSNTSGANNTALGYQAAYYTTSGSDNTFIGSQAGISNTTAGLNTAIGRSALYSNTTTSNNTAVGHQAGYSNTTGSLTAVGMNSLYSNTTGVGNIAFGGVTPTVSNAALQSNTTGTYNIAIGSGSLTANTTGGSNIAIGQQALTANTTTSNNTAVGHQALYSNTASNNTAVGYGAGYATTSGAQNTYIGRNAGQAITTGTLNVFVGDSSGQGITTGTRNVILGSYQGNTGGLNITTASNYVVLSDGDGNIRQAIDNSGIVALGTVDFTNTTRLKVASGSATARATSAQITVERTTAASHYEGICFNKGSARAAYILRVPNSDDLTFGFDAGGGTSEAMRIFTNNTVSIGTTTQYATLTVGGTFNCARPTIGITGQGAGFQDGFTLFCGSDFQDPNTSNFSFTNANARFATSRTGSVLASNPGGYIYEGATSTGSTSRCFAVLSNGNVQNTNNSYGSLSDINLKQDIVDASSQWDDIKALKVRKYRLKEEVNNDSNAKSHLGLIAQEVELVSAGLVEDHKRFEQKKDEDGKIVLDQYGLPEMQEIEPLKAIKYSVLYMKAVKALQEAMQRIETLEAKVSELQSK